MKQVFMIRDDARDDCVRSVLYAQGEIFHVLERPWLSNRVNESCICSGNYTAAFLERSTSGKYRQVYWLKSVPERSGILIHNGNIVDHTRGCLLIGRRRGTLAGQPAVLNSRTALFEFSRLMGSESFELHIFGRESC